MAHEHSFVGVNLLQRVEALLQLGGNHPDTLESMSNLALFLSEQKNRLGEAESLHRRVCARWSKSRGPEHPGTLSAVTQLAQFLDVKRSRSSLECAEEATKLYERAYLGRKAKLGSDHPSTHFSLFLLNRFKQKRAKREGGSNNNRFLRSSAAATAATAAVSPGLLHRHDAEPQKVFVDLLPLP